MHRSLRAIALALVWLAAAGAPPGPITAPPQRQDTPRTKFGGLAWGDLDGDGCLDVLVNVRAEGDSGRLYLSDCALPDPTFSDITDTHAPGILPGIMDRGVVWGDVDNDGDVDLARTGRNDVIHVFLNAGPSATPPFRLGGEDGTPDLVLDAVVGALNPEGLAWVDVDGDGWLDLMFENGEGGIDILANPADGTAAFTQATPDDAPRGLPTATLNGDFAAAADLDVDGDVDWVSRREGSYPDLFLNDGTGSFVAGPDLGNAINNDKGGVVFCDVDADGDFDLLWTAPDVTQIWQQEGVGGGTFLPTGLPLVEGCNADGVDCGDVDNDGDLDLFFSCDGSDQLHLNVSDEQGLAFERDDCGIADESDGEGAVFVDYDEDGDLDLLVNQTGSNVLWRSDANDAGGAPSLAVRAIRDLGDGLVRDDIGATVRILDYDGTPIGPVQEINGGKGHGSQKPPRAHFGLGAVPEDEPFLVQVISPSGEVIEQAMTPTDAAYGPTVVLAHDDQPDSDGDGVPDADEVDAGHDPLVYGPGDDDDDTGDDDTATSGDDDSTGDDDTTGDDDACADDDGIEPGSCACRQSAGGPAAATVALLPLALALRRRR